MNVSKDSDKAVILVYIMKYFRNNINLKLSVVKYLFLLLSLDVWGAIDVCPSLSPNNIKNIFALRLDCH